MMRKAYLPRFASAEVLRGNDVHSKAEVEGSEGVRDVLLDACVPDVASN
jgi:hypothetical protein